jgi:hypothetical protein
MLTTIWIVMQSNVLSFIFSCLNRLRSYPREMKFAIYNHGGKLSYLQLAP